jgi:hypothetical protein
MSQPTFLSDIPSLLRTWASNFQRNSSAAFTNLKPKDVIRIIIVVCAYILIIRPMLVRLANHIQAKQHNQSVSSDSSSTAEQSKRHVDVPGLDSDSESDDDGGKGDVRTGEWGRKTRLRQRRLVRKAMELKDEMAANESDDEIKEFLVD